ncbi:uncharacterized protein UTRI_01606 [Ustilago trichophora]|uniref:Uncharacterized protein n=1 Tax=Ustilago trichophora TaxID=86804 RepID=A0A5C3DXH1_9BASI|nr:uncharacterized protein UTRI_01606 [Ustilago trichophora]
MTVNSQNTSASLPDFVTPSSTRSNNTSCSSLFTTNTSKGRNTNTNTDSDTSSASEDRRAVETLLPAYSSPITPTPNRRRRNTDALEQSPGCARSAAGTAAGQERVDQAMVIDLTDSSPLRSGRSRVADRMAAAFASTGPMRTSSVLPQPRSSDDNRSSDARAASHGVSAGIGAIRNSATAHHVFGTARPPTPSMNCARSSTGVATGSDGEARARSVVAKTEEVTAPTTTVDDISIVGVVKAEASANSLAVSPSSTSNAMGTPTQLTTTNSAETRTAIPATARLATPVFGRTSTPAPIPAIIARQPSNTTSTTRARQPSSSTNTHRNTAAPAPMPRSLSAIRRARSLTPYTRASTYSRGLVGLTRSAAAAVRGVTTRRNAVEEATVEADDEEVVMIDSFRTSGTRNEEGEGLEAEDDGRVCVVIPTSELPGGRQDSTTLTTSDPRSRPSAGGGVPARSNSSTTLPSSNATNGTSTTLSTTSNRARNAPTSTNTNTTTTTTTRSTRNETTVNPRRTSNLNTITNSTSDSTSDSDDTEVIFTDLQTRSQIQLAARAANAQLRQQRAARRNAGPLGGPLLAVEASRAAAAAVAAGRGGSRNQVYR